MHWRFARTAQNVPGSDKLQDEYGKLGRFVRAEVDDDIRLHSCVPQHVRTVRGEMDPKKASLKVRVVGRVQGVGYRYFTERMALEIGLSGYVMNCGDGSVEVMVEGERHALDQLLLRLKQGPFGARVEKVDETWGPYTGQFTGFAIRFGG